MPSTTDIRAQFLDFFASKGHAVLPSSSLVPHNDPTLMFANAGMNQFKNIFTGIEPPPAPPRAATSQKCVRAGGKHNDLDNVGYTARHHTFFEMLGNFSFGDYFKEQAISHAWELMTRVWGIDAGKLCVTVYHTDNEAFTLWKKITGLPDEKIIRIASSDNFWAMGDTGPCGPCSEIFYDHGAHITGGPPGSAEADGDRFIEIWNLVFMQYEQKDKDTRIDLPKPSIDTGMGLERLTALLQGVHDNYDIDLFKTLIAAAKDFAPPPGSLAPCGGDASYRIIADHLRSTSFLIADGVLPSNEGRGYVLRRIMRRAMRHAHILGCKTPLMHQLVPTLVHEMGAAFPELKRAEAVIIETLKLEEEKFKDTLERGLNLLEEEKTKLSPPPGTLAPGGGVFPGEIAFKLYDTYGFPLDLTQDILRGDSITVDMHGFTAAMNEQKAKARAAWKGSGQATTAVLWFDIKERIGVTEFLGYAMDAAQAQIVALVKDGKEVAELKKGESGQIIVNQTPFYGESGGQVGDDGLVFSKTGGGRVMDTTKPLEGIFVHEVNIDDGVLHVGDTVKLEIDVRRRDRIRANHSATHLLHAVLRRQLGEHVTQKGSLVDADRLRFDVTHPKQITPEELAAIEAAVNQIIWQNSEATMRLMSQDDAIKAGAMALFGEKYAAEVRVINMGIDDAGGVYSIELCGGTHVKRTGDIGLFKIISESGISAGVRRIEAVTQASAYTYVSEQEACVKELAAILKTKPEEIAEKVITLVDDKKKLEKQLSATKKQLAMCGGAVDGANGAAEIETIGSINLAAKIFADLDAKSLRDLANAMQKKHPDAVSVLIAANEGKASIVIAVGKELADKVDAQILVKAGVAAVGGHGGGGRPDFAQGGWSDDDRLEAALAAVKAALA